MKLTRIAISALLAARIATAQPTAPKSPFDAQEQSSLALLFQSSRTEDLAWAAYLAANYQQSKFIPQITGLLKSDDHRLQAVTFDALIRLRADVPEATLAPFIDTFFEPTVILLARDTKKHGAFLMTLLDRPLEGESWVVVNSLLTEARTPGYAARLLHDWTLHLQVAVISTGSVGVSHGDRGASASCGDSLALPPSGFPPIFYYHFDEHLRPTEIGTFGGGPVNTNLLVGGVHPIVFYAYNSASHCSPTVLRDEYRYDYLRVLEVQSLRGENPPESTTLRWTSEKTFRSDAEAFMDKVRAFVQQNRSRLTQQKLLDVNDPTQPKIDVEVLDLRGDKSLPLPGIDWHF